MNKYNNGIVYKLVCKDSSINDIYIGSTTNFTKRKCHHKSLCNNNSNVYKYEFIRAHGGWNNWDMIEILKVNCNDRYELEKEERAQFDIYKPTLNKYRPQITNIENYETNKDRAKTHYEANKDQYKAYHKAHYEANQDKVKAYREANKDKRKAYKKAYNEANKDKFNVYQRAYRAKKKAEKLAALEASN